MKKPRKNNTLGTTLKPKKKKSTTELIIKAISITWVDFTQSSSVQGLKYITDPNSKKITKLIWMTIFSLCFIAANLLVDTFYIDFISNPTRMNIDTDYAPVVEINFPAVTICDANFINYVKVSQLLNNLTLPENMTKEIAQEYIYQAGGIIGKGEFKEDDLIELQNIVELNSYTTAKFMSAIQNSCEDFLFECRWEMNIMNCNNLFQKSRTYIGYCCSFNINQTGLKYYNKYARIHGVRGGLSVIVKPGIDDRGLSATYSVGFRIFVHKNSEFPNTNTISKIIPIDNEVLVKIRPTEITCSDRVRQLTAKDRQCVFPDEKKLAHFPEYDDDNCDVDCQLSEIIKRCHCIPFFYEEDPKIPICNFTNIPCLVENSAKVKKVNRFNDCDCPTNCQDVNFDVGTDAIPLYSSDATVESFYDNVGKNMSIVHVYIGSQTYRRLRRDLLTDLLALIANLGGTYSLFVGMSAISVIEIVYFCTVIFRKNYLKLKIADRKMPLFVNRLKKPKIQVWTNTPVIDLTEKKF